MTRIERCAFVGFWFALTAIQGCMYSHKVTLRSELAQPSATRAITILTKDSTMYVLNDYRLTDSSLIGVGRMWKEGPKTVFNGEIRFSSIGYIYAESSSFFKGVLVAGFTGYFIATAIAGLEGQSGLSANPQVKYTGPSGTGTCPLIYSWDGNHYILEAEAMGTALSKGLETNSFCTLPSVVNDNSQLKLQIWNNQPETDYLNSVSLVGVESRENSDVVLDVYDIPWAICDAQGPLSAIDQDGNNVIGPLLQDDSNYWEVNPSQKRMSPGDETVVDLTFAYPGTGNQGTLFFKAMNTRYLECIVQTLSDFLGDETLPFVQALDNDPEMIKLVNQWFGGLGLRVYVADTKGWTYVGAIPIEANQTSFRRAIRIEVPQPVQDRVKIRLRCPVATWKLDAVKIDWSTASPLQAKPVRLVSATDVRGKDVKSVLALADDQYVTMVPPDSLNLIFEPLVASKGDKLTYISKVSGFLHEWIPKPQSSPYSMSGPREGRVEAIKTIMRENPQQIVLNCFRDSK